MDAGVVAMMFERKRDSIETAVLQAATATDNYLKRRGLTVQQEVAAALYLESTLEFAKQLQSTYADTIEQMVHNYTRMSKRKNGQKDLF